MKHSNQTADTAETLAVGILLAVAGGFLDAYTYIFRGGVFANAQTGNIVLLGIQIANRDLQKSLLYLSPIVAFAAGVVIADIIKRRYFRTQAIRWEQIILLIELAVLASVVFIPLGDMDFLANILVSFVCSLQVCGFRNLHGSPYATTMCTGNLRSGMEQLCLYFSTKDKEAGRRSLHYFIIILSFIAGAAFAAAMAVVLKENSVWLSCGLLFTVFILISIKERNRKKAAG